MTTRLPSQAGRFVWHDLMTTDVGAAQDFYSALLDWTVEPFDVGEHGTYPMIKVGETGIGGYVSLEPDSDLPSHWICYVAVDDVGDTCARVAEHDGNVCIEPFHIPNVGWTAVIEDPTGAVLSPFQPDGPAAEGDPETKPGLFGWYQLNCTDPVSAETFYRNVFGWTARTAQMGGGTYWTFFAGEKMVAGMMQMPPAAQSPSHWLPYLRVADLGESTSRATTLGGRVLVPPTRLDEPASGSFAVIADPTGAALGLYRP